MRIAGSCWTLVRRVPETERVARYRVTLRVLPAPIAFPAMTFRLLWHERSHRAGEHQLMRANIARALKHHFPAEGRTDARSRRGAVGR